MSFRVYVHTVDHSLKGYVRNRAGDLTPHKRSALVFNYDDDAREFIASRGWSHSNVPVPGKVTAFVTR